MVSGHSHVLKHPYKEYCVNALFSEREIISIVDYKVPVHASKGVVLLKFHTNAANT